MRFKNFSSTATKLTLAAILVLAGYATVKAVSVPTNPTGTVYTTKGFDTVHTSVNDALKGFFGQRRVK